MGAARHSLADRKHDLYETPACATLALLQHVTLPPVVWEPCAGKGAIKRVLEAAGHRVVASDLVAYPGADSGIETPIDFLMERRAPGCDCIITNPPFKLGDDVIEHGLSLVSHLFVLLRFMSLEGVDGRVKGSGRRSRLIDEHCVAVWLGRERLPFMHRDGWEGPKQSNSGAPFAWFQFRACRRRPNEPIALRRISWRAADAPLLQAAE